MPPPTRLSVPPTLLSRSPNVIQQAAAATRYLVCLGLCLLAAGCGDASRAICVGRLEGRNGPIKSGTVSLVSLDDSDESPVVGELESDGKFEVLTADSELVPVGRYRIEYTGPAGADAAFAGWSVTPAQVEIHRGQNYLDLELTPPADTVAAH